MKRIPELDALRGIALFGIGLVNIFVFHAPYSYYGEFYGAFTGVQATTVNIVVDFIGGKYLFIFAFLFGYGIVLQRNSRSEEIFRTYWVKRMLVLLIFGILHILFFWFGDILASYALLGLLILPLLKLSNRGVLTLGIFFILFRPLYYFGVTALGWPMVQMGKPTELNDFIAIFQRGSYSEIFILRMNEFFAFTSENLVWYIPKTMGVFLVGIYAARKSIFIRVRENSRKAVLLSVLLISVSTVWIYFKMDVFGLIDLDSTPIWRPILISANVVFETTLAMSYIIGFSLLFQNSLFFTKILAKTGRLALTNYITQSLICVLVFYGYGFGYYGKLKPTDLVLLSIAIFALNLSFSLLYLKYKSIGPLEYLWRKWVGR
jgi:uncharacterized protein